MFVCHVCFIAREVIYIRQTHVHLKHIFLSRLRTALEILEKLLRTLYKSRNVEPPRQRENFNTKTSEKNSRPLLCLQCPTQLIVLSSYWSVCTCYLDIAKSGALIQFIILCNVTAILIFFVVKLEEEACQCWLLKLIHSLIIVTLLILSMLPGQRAAE